MENNIEELEKANELIGKYIKISSKTFGSPIPGTHKYFKVKSVEYSPTGHFDFLGRVMPCCELKGYSCNINQRSSGVCELKFSPEAETIYVEDNIEVVDKNELSSVLEKFCEHILDSYEME